MQDPRSTLQGSTEATQDQCRNLTIGIHWPLVGRCGEGTCDKGWCPLCDILNSGSDEREVFLGKHIWSKTSKNKMHKTILSTTYFSVLSWIFICESNKWKTAWQHFTVETVALLESMASSMSCQNIIKLTKNVQVHASCVVKLGNLFRLDVANASPKGGVLPYDQGRSC